MVMVFYYVTSFFTCITTTDAVEIVRKGLLQDNITNLSPNQIWDLLDRCLNTTHYNENTIHKHNECFYRQSCAMGSPMCSIVITWRK